MMQAQWDRQCLLLALLLILTQQVAEAQSDTAQVLTRLAPLADDVPRTILNPYHADPAWKLWAIDPEPLIIDKPHFQGTFEPQSSRKYPLMGLQRGLPSVMWERIGQHPWAGAWDDAYMSLDNHHTRLREPLQQFIDAGKMVMAWDVETMLQLGVNFTSQSYADRGRAIVDDIANNLNTERHFFFANCVRATPAHISYKDERQDQATDVYDGLFAHSYQSVGQSGSEMHALYKMMLAGAAMPRRTKNLLKQHGAYATALLTLFKAALPYTDAQGRRLPFEHELRHRPAYSSHGTPQHVHFCPANAHYHGYDDQLHLQAMMEMARSLTSAPPVAVVSLQSLGVRKSGMPLTDSEHLRSRVKCLALTNIRIWGEPGETIEAVVDLNKSYDLEKKWLIYRCQPLYPNQKNVAIREEATGLFRIRVTHDPNLPKGRIPVICTAYNDASLPSNPVFINFYWPGEKELDDYYPARGLPDATLKQIRALGLKKHPVNVNRRPVTDLGLLGDAIRCRPGETVSLDLKATDPEGYPVRVYRRAQEMGSIEAGRFKAEIPAGDRDKIYRVHFVFADGTGGYTGQQIKLLVSKEELSPLPEDWGITALGPMPRVVQVTHDADTYTFGPQPLDAQADATHGTFLFRPVDRTMDLSCRVPSSADGVNIGLMISNTLDGYSRRAGIGSFQGKVSGVIRTMERSFGTKTFPWSGRQGGEGLSYRLIRREDRVAGYVSAEAGVWRQVMTGDIKLFDRCYAGLIYRGDPWTSGVCQNLGTPRTSLPILTLKDQAHTPEGQYQSPLEIRLSSAGSDIELRYTLDGTEPSAVSPLYQNALTLRDIGRQELRVKTFQGDVAGDTLLSVFHMTEKGAP